jgi:hypothetical protein
VDRRRVATGATRVAVRNECDLKRQVVFISIILVAFLKGCSGDTGIGIRFLLFSFSYWVSLKNLA